MKWYIQGLVFGYLSAPQRTGRLGRGLEMVDGHQEHSTRLSGSSIELALPLPLPQSVWLLGLGGALVSSTELSFLCLDSIESGGRAGASGLGSLPPSLRVVFSFPWLVRRGSVRLLGREPSWSGEKDRKGEDLIPRSSFWRRCRGPIRTYKFLQES
ncbi:unnamed protein product [Microthlaspi erraticum]|uniref:Uncharacterized protein n=1 Tax=Microthlaspi erraticum TaxID=1685480 RepID=A0A6D2HFT4_9BRAS|nr:unnamed protein product [Microthlaspi erraticum]